MVIVVGGIKGGSGKSTIATNLAVMRSADRRDLLLIDTDEQETATDFTVLRNQQLPAGAGYTGIRLTGPAVRTETQRLAGKYQDILIDTGGRDTLAQRAALAVADLFLVPFVPRSFDVWTIEKVATLVEEVRPGNPRLHACAFLNRADSRGQDNQDAVGILRESPSLTFLDTPIGSRKAFSNAATRGLAVTELNPPDPKAISEIQALYRCVFQTAWKSTTEGAR